jgi:hypothetical protein
MKQRQINMNQVFKYITGRRQVLLGPTVEGKGSTCIQDIVILIQPGLEKSAPVFDSAQ